MFGQNDSIPSRPADWCMAVACLALLAMLFSPVLAQNVDQSRRNACMDNSRLLTMGLLNYESAKGFFPTASTAPLEGRPGNDGGDEPPGYSWQTMILPFMNEMTLYNALAATDKFASPPFALRVNGVNGEVIGATLVVDRFVCPNFAGQPVVDVGASDYKADEAAGGAPALTNYFALSSSHMVKHEEAWLLAPTPAVIPGGGDLVAPNPKAVIQGNGVLPFISKAGLDDAAGDWRRIRGVTFAGIRDGSSNTLFFGESREQAYAAWIDGQVAWVVAAWPQNPTPPRMIPDPAPETPTLGWDDADKAPNFAAMVQQRFGLAGDGAGVYLPEAMWSGTKDRKFGPSGNHVGVAIHGFADAHCEALADTIDAAVYMHLTTRAGSEVVDERRY
jgi:hypothetical protein